MKRCSSLTIGMVAAGCLLAGASPATAQAPYYPPPAWDQTLQGSARFVLVLFQQLCVQAVCSQVARAVLDRETGLVWERQPSNESVGPWPNPLRECAQRIVGNRMGWRLPTADELSSLVDPSNLMTGLPPGHPFQIPTALTRWTSTEMNEDLVLVVEFSTPFAQDLFVLAGSKGGLFPVWCVRGGAK